MKRWLQLRWFGVSCLVLAMVGWGVTFSMNRWLLSSVLPGDDSWGKAMTLATFRFAIAGLVLVPWAAAILWRRGWPGWRDGGLLLVLGMLGIAGYHLFANAAQCYASASLIVVLHQMTPVVAFAGGLLFLRERLTLLKVLGLAVATAGAVGYSLLANEEALSGDNIPKAVFLIFLVSVDWTCYLTLAKVLLRRWSATEITVLSNAAGSLSLVAVGEALRPFGGGVEWALLNDFTPLAWGVLLFLAIIAGIGCYILYNAGLRPIEASRAAVFTYLMVPVGMLAALALPGELHETISPAKIAAAAVIIAGVWLVTYKRKGEVEP